MICRETLDNPFKTFECRDDNGAIYEKIVEVSGGKNNAKIGIITAASADAVENGDYYANQFMEYGAHEAYWLPIHAGNPEGAYDQLVALRVSVSHIERKGDAIIIVCDDRRAK